MNFNVTGKVGTPINNQALVSPGATYVAADALPAGATLAPNGAIGGTPTAAGNSVTQVTKTLNGQTSPDTVAFTITA